MAAPVEYSFFFRAMTNAGSSKMGVRAAVDEADLAERLKKDGLLMLQARKLPIGAAPPAGLSLKDEVLLNEQIRVLLSRGVPLVEALEVASSVVSGAAKEKVEKLRDLVAAGAGFAKACQDVGGFDDVTIAVYRSAERTGDLAGAAHRLEQAARRRLALRGKAITVLIYPVIVLTVAALLMSVLLVFVVPSLSGQIRQLNPNLPWYSEVVFSLGEFLSAHTTAAGLAVLGLIAVLVVVRKRVLAGLTALFKLIPAVKGLILRVEMTRFFSVMAAMTKSGVPLADALATSTGVISDNTLRAQLASLRKRLVEGGVLRSLIEEVTSLPLATRRLLMAADRAGDMDSAFDSLAEATSEEVEQRSGRLLAVLEPAMIVAVFGLIAPIIIAVAVPMLTTRTGMG